MNNDNLQEFACSAVTNLRIIFNGKYYGHYPDLSRKLYISIPCYLVIFGSLIALNMNWLYFTFPPVFSFLKNPALVFLAFFLLNEIIFIKTRPFRIIIDIDNKNFCMERRNLLIFGSKYFIKLPISFVNLEYCNEELYFSNIPIIGKIKISERFHLGFFRDAVEILNRAGLKINEASEKIEDKEDKGVINYNAKLIINTPIIEYI